MLRTHRRWPAELKARPSRAAARSCSRSRTRCSRRRRISRRRRSGGRRPCAGPRSSPPPRSPSSWSPRGAGGRGRRARLPVAALPPLGREIDHGGIVAWRGISGIIDQPRESGERDTGGAAVTCREGTRGAVGERPAPDRREDRQGAAALDAPVAIRCKSGWSTAKHGGSGGPRKAHDDATCELNPTLARRPTHSGAEGQRFESSVARPIIPRTCAIGEPVAGMLEVWPVVSLAAAMSTSGARWA